MHRHAVIREHTAAIEASRATYQRENHCPCGEWIVFAPTHRDIRQCFRCKRRDDIWQEEVA